MKSPSLAATVQTVRFAAAFTCLYAALVMRPRLHRAAFGEFFDTLPEAAVAALVLHSAPLVVGLVSLARWLRLAGFLVRPEVGPATRILIVSCLPFAAAPPVSGAAGLSDEIAYRVVALVAMLLCIDGPLVPPQTNP
jgi:hypothetical protein